MRLRRKIIAVISNLLLVAGLLLPAVGAYAEQPLELQNNSAPGTWNVTATGPVYNTTNNTTTWTYEITKTSSGPGLSHFDLGMCQGLSVVSSSPTYTSIGNDGSTGLTDVIKWDTPNLSTVTVTYQGLLAPGAQTWYVKAGNGYVGDTIQAASCATVNGSFTVSKKVSAQVNDANPVGSIELVGGGTAYYYYTVTNIGNVPLNLEADDDRIDDPVTFSPNPVAPGQTSTATASKPFAALAPGADPVTEINTITVTGTYAGLTFGPNQATAQVINKPAADPEPSFTIAKTVSKTNSAATGTESISFDDGLGGTAYFFYTITNNGTVDLNLVSGADNKIPTALTWSATTIPVGESVTATASKTFAQPAPGSDPTTETNTLSVTVSYDGTTLPEQTDTASVTLVAAPNKLKLTSMCTATPDTIRGWRVRNTNNVAVTYVWQLVGTEQTGTRTVPANSDDFFETTTVGGANTLKILVNGSQQDVKASSGERCAADFTVNKTVSTTNDPTTGQPSLTLDGIGGTVYYFFSITNTGQFPLDVVEAIDDPLGTISMSQSTIPVGGVATATVTKSYPQLAPGSGETETHTNVFSAKTTYNHVVYGPKTEDATVTITAAPNKLKLTSMCSLVPAETRSWRVRNTNNVPVTYTWQLVGTEQTGTRTVAANSDDLFETNTVGGSNTLKILVNGAQQDVKASGGAICPVLDLEVTKTVSTSDAPATGVSSLELNGTGGTVYYHYTLTNKSNVPVSIHTANDDKLGGVTFSKTTEIAVNETVTGMLSTTFPQLAPGSEQVVTVDNIITARVAYGNTVSEPKTATASVVNRAAPNKLKLTSMCSVDPAETRAWRVRNTNSVPVTYTWQLVGTEQSGTRTVPANTDDLFETNTVGGPNTLKILVNGSQQDVKASGGAQCPAPAFNVTKHVSATQDAGTLAKSLTLEGTGGRVWYVFAIENTGNVPLTVKNANDNVLGDISFTPTTVAAGETITAVVSHDYPQLAPGSGQSSTVTNTITVVATDGTTDFTDSDSATVTNNAAPNKLKLTSMCSVVPTETRAWRVRNTNSVPVTYTWVLVGTEQTGTRTVAANSDDLFETNTVEGPNTLKILVNGSQQDVKASGGAACQSASFEVTKQVNSENNAATATGSITLEGGGTAYYFYTITNTGETTLNLVSAVDDILGDITFNSTTILPKESITATADKLFAELDPWDDPQEETNTITVIVSANGTNLPEQTAQATVYNNPEEAHPDFTLTKHVSANDSNGGLSDLALVRGGRAYYFYTITNTGNVPLRLEEAIDDKLGDIPFFVIVPTLVVEEEMPGYLMPGESWDAMLWKDFTALPAGQSETETNIATVTMFYPAEERSITKTAEATVTNRTPRDPDPVTPGFSVSKTVSATNNATTGTGSITLNGDGTAYYFYTITNTGQTTLNLVSAVDDKLGALNFTPTTIPVGGSATATANKTFSAPPAGGPALTEVNTVTVTVASGGTNLPAATATASVTVNPPPVNPDFTVVKRVSTTNNPTTGRASLTIEGDTLVYYFYTLTNTGNVPLNLLDAVDDKIGDLSFSPSLVPLGGTATATASKIIAAGVTETNVVTVRTTYGTTVVGPRNDRVTVVNTGEPVGSVEVRVLDGSPRNNGQLIPIPGALVTFTGGRTGRTNDNGSIVFTNLPFGGYSADASAEDPQNPTPASIQSGNGSTAIDFNNRDEVINIILGWDAPLAEAKGTETPGTTSLVVAVCYPFTTVGGEIVAEGPAGAVLNLTGKPAADGTYRFEGLTPGEWKLSMRATGMSDVVTQTVTVVENNTYTLDMSAACPMGTIAGRICSPSAPGAELTAMGPDGKTASTRVAANGILGQWRDYVLNNLIPGTWTLSLKLPNNDPVSQTLEIKAGETTMAKDFTLACTGSPGPATSPLYLYGGLMFLTGVALKLRLRRKGAAA